VLTGSSEKGHSEMHPVDLRGAEQSCWRFIYLRIVFSELLNEFE
jgi:hypothetical protein